MSGIDPNVWYIVSEGRVDKPNTNFTSALQIRDGKLVVNVKVNQHWQFQPVDGKANRFLLRTDSLGPDEQLAVCYSATEIDPNKTGVCMQPSTVDDSHKWEIEPWVDGEGESYKFINVKNGSSYYLDVHPGNPIFMSSNINSDVRQPAQHWLLSSVKQINDGGYSTIYSGGSTATNSPSPQTSSSPQNSSPPGSQEQVNNGSNSGLSPGASAGIGVGVALALIALALAAFFLWRRHQRRKRQPPAELGASPHGHGMRYPEHHQYQTPPPKEQWDMPPSSVEAGSPEIYEAPTGDARRHELDAGGAGRG